jgi:pyruvate carboxylase subunit B
MYGRWEKIETGYGRAVLGYFGKTPLPPDPEVVKKASEQLNLPVFEGDPLEAAPKNIEPAKKALEEMNLPVNDENTFLVLACMVPGKKIEANEGIRLLTGKGKIDIPLKQKEKQKKEVKTTAPVSMTQGPVKSKCVVEENGRIRTFVITTEPIGVGTTVQTSAAAQTEVLEKENGTPIFHAFAGSVDVADILVKEGDSISKGQVIAQVEAMKAKHDIKAPKDGRVISINAKIGDEIDSSHPILTIN